jgi:hypothetical protein
MSKKRKKIEKAFKSVVKDNKVLFAALGGAAAGMTLAGIIGTEKGKAVLDAVEDSIATTAERMSNGYIRKSEKGVGKNG